MIKNLYIILLLAILAIPYSAQVSNQNENRYKLAQSYERNGEFEKAKIIYIELSKIQSWNNKYFEGLNNVYLRLKEYKSSIDLLNEKLKETPNDINKLGMLGSTYYVMGDSEKAFEIWDQVLEVDTAPIIKYRIAANYAIQNRAFDKAIEILKLGNVKSKDPKLFLFDLANLYSITMKFGKAAEEYCNLLQEQPNQLGTIKSRLIKYFNTHNAIDETIGIVKLYTEKNETVFLDLLSYLYIQNGSYQQAFETIIILNDKLNNEGLEIFTFAQDAFRDGEYEVSSKAFELIVKKYPRSPYYSLSKLGFAKTLEAKINEEFENKNIKWKPYKKIDTSGSFKYQKVINAYNKLINNFNDGEIKNEALYRIGIIKFGKMYHFDAADNLFKSILLNSYQSKFTVLALDKLSEIAIIKDSLDKSEEYLNNIITNKKTFPLIRNKAVYKKAKISFWKGDFERALNYLNSVTKNLSDDMANDAIELSIIINTLKTDSLSLIKYANADFLTERRSFEDAALEFRYLAESSSLILVKELANFKFAEIMISLDKYPLAMEILENISDKELSSVYADKSLFLLANCYQFGIGNLEKAKQAYEKLLANFPNSLYLDKARERLSAIKLNESTSI